MNREDYISMRQSGTYNINLFFTYFIKKSKAKVKLSFHEFNMAFRLYLQMNAEEIMSRLDNEFNVITVSDKDGNLVKVF